MLSNENGNLTNLSPGFYTVTITDQSVNPDCPIQETIEITDYESAVVEWTLSQDDFNPDYNISCFGASDGEINLDVSGGTDDYSFSWTGVDSDDIVIYSADTEDISNLSAGTYTVIITSYKNDGEPCFPAQEYTIPIIQPEELITTATPEDIDPLLGCTGDCIGSIIVDIEGGTPPYSFIVRQYNDDGSFVDVETVNNVNSNDLPYSIESLCEGVYSVSTF